MSRREVATGPKRIRWRIKYGVLRGTFLSSGKGQEDISNPHVKRIQDHRFLKRKLRTTIG